MVRLIKFFISMFAVLLLLFFLISEFFGLSGDSLMGADIVFLGIIGFLILISGIIISIGYFIKGTARKLEIPPEEIFQKYIDETKLDIQDKKEIKKNRFFRKKEVIAVVLFLILSFLLILNIFYPFFGLLE